MPGGRPSVKPDNLPELVEEYINECTDDFTEDIKKVNIPTVEGFALKIGVNPSTIYAWEKDDAEFSNTLSNIKAEQKKRLFSEGLAGNYNPTIAKLALSANHGMVEKKEVDQTNRFPDGIDLNFIEPNG